METEMKLTSNLLLGGLAACLLTLPVMADEIYTYTGQDFQVATGVYSTSDFVSGSFTLASPLGDNEVDDSLTPLSYSFSDGVQTITSASPPSDVTFDVSTDASGNIEGWFINLESPSPYFQISTQTTPNQEDLGVNGGSEGYNFLDEGSWTMTSSGPSAVPEPGNVALIGLGLVAIGLVRRKVQQRNQPVA
jgi:PEP-CTERM motif